MYIIIIGNGGGREEVREGGDIACINAFSPLAPEHESGIIIGIILWWRIDSRNV